jgi:hypothetical protein
MGREYEELREAFFTIRGFFHELYAAQPGAKTVYPSSYDGVRQLTFSIQEERATRKTATKKVSTFNTSFIPLLTRLPLLQKQRKTIVLSDDEGGSNTHTGSTSTAVESTSDMVNIVKYIAVAVASLSQKISQMQVDGGAPISVVNGNGLHFKKIKVAPCPFNCCAHTFTPCPLQTGVSVRALSL